MAYLEGSSSKDILGNVRRTAKALFQQALRGASQDIEDKGVDTLISERDKLRHEEMKLSTELHLSKQLLVETLEDVEVGDGKKFITEAEAEVKKLEDELLSMKLNHFQDNKLLECFHYQEFLMKQLFPTHLETEDKNKAPSSIEQQVITLQTKLSDLLTMVKELETLRKDLEANQVELTRTQACCRELMSKTELEYDNDDDEHDTHGSRFSGDGADEDESKNDCAGIITARSRCLEKRTRDQVMLYRHTLLCLIGQSGVDWSEDEELCKLVVALGQPSRWTEGHRF